MIVTVRHLKDANALRSHGFDAPLVPGQEQVAKELTEKLVSYAKEIGCTRIRVLYCPGTLRIRETAEMVVAATDFPIVLEEEGGLRELEQGAPRLPNGYNDGEYLPLMDAAWNAFCEESYVVGNYSYKFGSHVGYPELNGKFTRLGESLVEFLPRHYAFFIRLLVGWMDREGELLVLCSNSMLPAELFELVEVERRFRTGQLGEVKLEDLPKLFWKVFTEERGKTMPTRVGFGETFTFDLSGLRNSRILELLEKAVEYFERRRIGEHPSLQQRLNTTSNDYSSEDEVFGQITGVALDSENPVQSRVFAPVSVVIPYYRDGARVLRTLDAIAAQSLTKAEMGQVEVLLVDDGSRDNLADLVLGREYPFELRTLLNYRNRGRSYVRNLGARSAKHDILVFIDSDILLTAEFLREHVVRNMVCPGHIYNSLIDNIGEFSEVEEFLALGSGLPVPPRWREYRTEEFVTPDFLGVFPVEEAMQIRPLAETRNFRDFGFGRRIGPYDLGCMMATYAISLTRELFERVGGFSSEFLGWGMEDSYFGAVAIAAGAKIIPVLSAGGYHVAHPPRSGGDGEKRREFERNIFLYREMLTRRG